MQRYSIEKRYNSYRLQRQIQKTFRESRDSHWAMGAAMCCHTDPVSDESVHEQREEASDCTNTSEPSGDSASLTASCDAVFVDLDSRTRLLNAHISLMEKYRVATTMFWSRITHSSSQTAYATCAFKSTRFEMKANAMRFHCNSIEQNQYARLSANEYWRIHASSQKARLRNEVIGIDCKTRNGTRLVARTIKRKTRVAYFSTMGWQSVRCARHSNRGCLLL